MREEMRPELAVAKLERRDTHLDMCEESRLKSPRAWAPAAASSCRIAGDVCALKDQVLSATCFDSSYCSMRAGLFKVAGCLVVVAPTTLFLECLWLRRFRWSGALCFGTCWPDERGNLVKIPRGCPNIIVRLVLLRWV